MKWVQLYPDCRVGLYTKNLMGMGLLQGSDLSFPILSGWRDCWSHHSFSKNYLHSLITSKLFSFFHFKLNCFIYSYCFALNVYVSVQQCCYVTSFTDMQISSIYQLEWVIQNLFGSTPVFPIQIKNKYNLNVIKNQSNVDLIFVCLKRIKIPFIYTQKFHICRNKF